MLKPLFGQKEPTELYTGNGQNCNLAVVINRLKVCVVIMRLILVLVYFLILSVTWLIGYETKGVALSSVSGGCMEVETLQYADDTIIRLEANLEAVRNMKIVITCFKSRPMPCWEFVYLLEQHFLCRYPRVWGLGLLS